MLIAYGIKLSIDHGLTGDVVLEAKTDELARHYERDFGAVRIPVFQSTAPRYLIADEAAKRIFFRAKKSFYRSLSEMSIGEQKIYIFIWSFIRLYR